MFTFYNFYEKFKKKWKKSEKWNPEKKNVKSSERLGTFVQQSCERSKLYVLFQIFCLKALKAYFTLFAFETWKKGMFEIFVLTVKFVSEIILLLLHVLTTKEIFFLAKMSS